VAVDSRTRAAYLVLVSSVFMSLGGAGIKLCSFGPWQLAGFRAVFSALTILLLMPEARRNWSWRILWPGASLAGTFILYVWGMKSTTAVNTIFIQFSAPLWVLLLSPLFLGERVRSSDFVSMAFFCVGLALFFAAREKATALSPDIGRGNVLALLSGVCYALTILGLRRLRGKGAAPGLVCGNALIFLVCAAVMIPAGTGFPGAFRTGTPRDWAVVAALGIFQVGVSYVLFTRALRVLPAVRATLIGLLEPVLNPLWVFLLFREERPGPLALLGAAVIVSTVAFQAVYSAGRKRKPL